ncbi:MAG: hypothetical protein AMXMBFR84_29250 [Candidatus Hydrogenedentota bacterium]
MTKAEILKGFEDSRKAVLDQFDAPEADWNKTYGVGKWTVRQILAHLADVEVVCLWRFLRGAAEPGSPVEAFDENKWAASLAYESRSLAVARSTFEANRNQLLELIAVMPESSLNNTILHSESGELKLDFFLGKMIKHAFHHVDQIRAAREGRSWTPA